jgi:hypothetical protein
LLGRQEREGVADTEGSLERTGLTSRLDQHAAGSWLNQLLMLKTHTYLRNTLLRDNDSTSMSHSLDSNGGNAAPYLIAITPGRAIGSGWKLSSQPRSSGARSHSELSAASQVTLCPV